MVPCVTLCQTGVPNAITHCCGVYTQDKTRIDLFCSLIPLFLSDRVGVWKNRSSPKRELFIIASSCYSALAVDADVVVFEIHGFPRFPKASAEALLSFFCTLYLQMYLASTYPILSSFALPIYFLNASTNHGFTDTPNPPFCVLLKKSGLSEKATKDQESRKQMSNTNSNL